MNKISEEKVKKLYEEKGYKILSPYINTTTSFIVEDKDGYKFNTTYCHFEKGQLVPKFGKRNKFFKENLALLIQKNNNGTKFIDAEQIYTSGKSRILVTLQCHCGNKYQMRLEHILTQKNYQCNNCANKQRHLTLIKKTNERYKKDLARQGFEMIDNTKLYKANDNVPIRELSTGYLGYVYASHIGHIKKMLVFSEYFNLDNYIYNVKQYIKNNNISTKCLGFSDKTDNNSQRKHKLVRFQCSCGEIFETTIFHFMNGKTRCDVCQSRISTNELKVRQFLEDNHIDFVREYRIEACRDLTVLPFDFQLTKTKQLIEIDGEQHFKPTRFGGISIEEAQSEFEQTQKRDKIKNNFCKQYNIPLLRIPYWDIDNDNYKQLILDYINTAQK